MGYLSFQILFFLLLAALLGFVIGWLWRGSRFQTELQDLDARWRTKLGEVEGERDRFVSELTQANEAKVRLEAEAKRSSEKHESSLQQLKRDHQTKIAAFADMEKRQTSLQSNLAAKEKELGTVHAEFANLQRTGSNDAGRLGKELAAASERAATLESSLKEARTANATCKSEVDRLRAEIAALKRSGSSSIAGATSSTSGDRTTAGGGALGLMSNTGSGVTSAAGAGTDSASAGGAAAGSGGSQGGTGSGVTSGTGTGSAGGTTAGSGGSQGGAGSGASLGIVGGTGTSSSGSVGSRGGTGDTSGGSAGLRSGASGGTGSGGGGAGSTGGAAGQSGRPEQGYTQRAASPSYLADTGGQGFATGGAQTTTGGSAAGGSSSGADDEEGLQPAALTAARGGRADDLKRISGVGPKLEKTLNGLGIFHFSQIAEFTPDNVAWVDRHLRFKGRIERENWIEQAKILAAGGETEFSKRQ